MKDRIIITITLIIFLSVSCVGIYAVYEIGSKLRQNQWDQRLNTFINQHFPVK